MIAFFGIVAIVGALSVLLDLAAMMNDPTPSLYHSGFTGFGLTLIVVGAVGAGCAFILK